MLSDVEKGYIAGFLDGEGSIGLGKRSKPAKCRPFRWVIFCHIYNTNKAVLEYIKKIGLSLVPKSKCNIKMSPAGQFNRKRACYRLTFSSRILKPLLTEIGDILIVKREQGTLLLEAMPLLMDNRRNWKEENDKRLEQIYWAIRGLNLGAKLRSASILNHSKTV